MLSFYPGLDDLIIWEHDDMDQVQAMDILKDFYETKFDSFSCSGFHSIAGFIEHNTNNIEDIIKYNEYDDSSPNMQLFIDDYKRKKLDWTK